MTAEATGTPRSPSLVELAASISAGRLTSESAVRSALDRIHAVNPALNAVVQLRAEAALADARFADRANPNQRGRLHGVPITIKDSLDTAELITTAGTQGRAAFVPAHDATVVTRLRAAGAIVIGKTNTPDLTLAFETDNLVYGRTNNPYDVTRTSGGSSGGAAAIIAAGAVALDIGSDTGGSIRVPAHFCGIAGLKPTAGRVPRSGHIIDFTGAVQGLTHIGPLARQVDDLALALEIIAGPDGIDPHVVGAPLGDSRRIAVGALRVGYFLTLGDRAATSETADALRGALTALEAAGCATSETEIPDSRDIYAVYSGLFWGDGGAAVERTLAKAGTTSSALFERVALARARADSSAQLTERYEHWDRWRSGMLRIFDSCDLLVCPAHAEPAPLHGRLDRANAAFTQLFNLTGWPAVVVRAGTSRNGLPIGVQCVAPPWREDIALAAARHLEVVFGDWPAPKV